MGLCVGRNLLTYDGVMPPLFEDESFDVIVCMGVFDCCDQEVTLKELLRVLKVNGKLLTSGKNKNYFGNDNPAWIAEVNARKKGQPNSFTDVRNILEQLSAIGNKLE